MSTQDTTQDHQDFWDMVEGENYQHLPQDQWDAALALPHDQRYTLVTLPAPGSGHNAGLVHAAATLYKMGVDKATAIEHLSDLYDHTRADAKTAPLRAVEKVWAGGGNIPAADQHTEKVEADLNLLARFRRTPANELTSNSPAPTAVSPRKVIGALFAPEDLICVQPDKKHPVILKVQDILDRAVDVKCHRFICPATFKKVEGVPNPKDPKNTISKRCNANVKARRYMVLEIDTADIEVREQFTTFALKLAAFAALVMVVDTGGKSLHFWFDGGATPDKIVKEVFKLACRHGADPHMAVLSQTARMPNVAAETAERRNQTLLYFDPTGSVFARDQEWDLVGAEKHFAKDSELLDIYFHQKSAKYLMQSSDPERWIILPRGNLVKQLQLKGYRANAIDGEALSPIDRIIAECEINNTISVFTGGACGRHAGCYDEGGGLKLLVTQSPVFIRPVKGKWDTIHKFLHHMLGHTPKQYEVFLSWLANSAKELRNDGKRRARFGNQTQMIHLIGPPNSGKTLLMEHILPHCFAGRSVRADAFFGDNDANFNAELFGAELLYLDDTYALSTKHDARVKLGEKVKQVTVGAGGLLSQKFQDPLVLKPWWRVVRLMNEQPQTINTLPPLDEGIADKVILLRAQSMTGGGIDMTGDGWFSKVEAAIHHEMPAFVNYLLNEHETPVSVKDPTGRYKVMSYHNPSVLEMIQEESVESGICRRIANDLFDRLFKGEFDGPVTEWRGTAGSLFDILSSNGTQSQKDQFRRMCPNAPVFSHQLRTIESNKLMERVGITLTHSKRLPADFYPERVKGEYYWLLRPAGVEGPENCI